MTRFETSRAARRRRSKKRAAQQDLRVESLENRLLLAADVAGLIPAPGSTGVAVDLPLQTSWTDPIRVGPGGGNIYIHNVDDNSLIEAINVRSDAVVIDGTDVTITPSNDLPANTNISVRVDIAKYRDMSTEVTSQQIFFEDFEALPLKNSVLDAPFDDYVVTMTGVLDVKTAGDYTFGSHAEDGSMLSLDVAQDGLDIFDDVLYEDDSTHGNDDRLHTCDVVFEEGVNEIESCVDEGLEDAVTLEVGEYEFFFAYFNEGGSGSGEFFYAPGYHEIFEADSFAIVGDDSQGIGVTSDGITATTYKEVAPNEITNLVAAQAVIDDESTIIGSGKIEFADVSEAPEGRFANDSAIPGAAEWALANDPDFSNWTDEGPYDWERDNSDLLEGGAPEYEGWTFMDKDFWILEQGNQDRTDFELGQGTLALVDPDAHDDYIGNGPHDNTACLEVLEFGPECGAFTSAISTPQIYLDGVSANTATLKFDSSWWDEDTQSAETRVEFFDAAGESMGENVLLRWESMPDSENFKPRVVDDGNSRNETIEVSLENPADAASMVVTFDMPYASNDWWWAIDNIDVTADVESDTSIRIADDSVWFFTTGDAGPVGPTIDLSTGTAAQSTQLGGFVAENALDDVANFTHTLADDESPVWQVELSDSYAFDSVTVFNRGASEGTLSCCPSRLRDITIQIVDFSGDVTTDFTGGDVISSSALLNAENELGGGVNTDGPISLDFSAGGAVGNLIRVTRTIDPDLSGTGGEGNADEGTVLSIDLVTASGTLVPSGPATIEGDINGDGSVGFPDFLILSSNFGSDVDPGTGGDLNGDGNVGFADFLVLSANFGKTAEAATAPAASQVDAALAIDLDSDDDDDDDLFGTLG